MADHEAKKIAAAAVLIAVVVKRKKARKQRKRNLWQKSWIARRNERGAYHALVQELRLEDEESYRRYLRMDTSTFEV